MKNENFLITILSNPGSETINNVKENFDSYAEYLINELDCNPQDIYFYLTDEESEDDNIEKHIDQVVSFIQSNFDYQF